MDCESLIRVDIFMSYFNDQPNNDYNQNNGYESFDDSIDIDLDDLVDSFSAEEEKKTAAPIKEELAPKEPKEESKLRVAIKKRDEKIINRKTAVARKTKGKVIHGIAVVKPKRFRKKVNENKPDTFLDKLSDRINDAKVQVATEKRKLDKANKLEQKRKEEERNNEIDIILQKNETYFAAGFLFVAFLTFIVLLAFSFGTRKKSPEEMSLQGMHESVENGEVEARTLESYRDFEQHEYNVKNAPFIVEADESNGTEEPSKTSATKAPKKTPAPTEEVTEPTETTVNPTEVDVTPTPSQEKKKIVIASGEDYYLFNFGEDGYSTTKLNVGDVYVTGIGTDSGVQLNVGQNGYDLDYGYLRIQNPYNVPSFSLRELMETPLVVTKGGTLKSPRIILCYTHTTEGYVITEEEKLIKNLKSLSGTDTVRSIVGRGKTLETMVKRAGVGIINITTVCDTDYSKAYTLSAAAVSEKADENPTCELTLDLHVKSFEYPTGTRYSVVKTANGKNYAPIQFIVTVNDETNPSWRENLKLALLIINKMNDEVPGISLGISLTHESKYNTTETYYGLTVELGFEGNLASEADNTAALLGSVLAEIYS